jgi:hypothetical protein
MALADNSLEKQRKQQRHRLAKVDFPGVILSRRSQDQPLSGSGRRLRAFAMVRLSRGTRGFVL